MGMEWDWDMYKQWLDKLFGLDFLLGKKIVEEIYGYLCVNVLKYLVKYIKN